MRTKVTLILLLLNVALLAVIFYARREWREDQELALRGKRVLGHEAIGMKSLEITAAGSDKKIRLERRDESSPWELKVPIDWPANDFAVRRIVHELEFLETETSFPVSELDKNGQSLADYGLNPPSLTLDFTRASSTPGAPDVATRLQIGDTTQVGKRLYVLSPDGATVHVVSRSLAESLIVGMEEFRADTLFTIPVFEVRSITLQNTAPAPRVRLLRDGARWSFQAPIVTRASKVDAEVVVSGLNRLRALDFLTDAPVADTGLDKPSLRVTVEGNSRRETLLLGRPYPLDPSVKKDPVNPVTPYYASMEGRPQVFITSIPDGEGSLLDTLRRAQETLRDTRVLDFEPSAVTAISLSAPGLREPLVLRREDDAVWRIVRPGGAPALPADSKLVANLLQRLSLLTAVPHVKDASPFLRDAPSAAEVENYGFNLPQREIILTLGPSKTLTLQLGVSSSNGGTVQARTLSHPFIYAVAPDTLNDFPVVANIYRERTLRTLPEGARITSLTLANNTAPDRPLVSFKPSADQSWDDALSGETEPRRAAIKAVLAALTTLRAKQFVSDTFTPTTLVDGRPTPWKYTLEASFALDGGAQTGVTSLQIADRSGGGEQLAGSKELGVVFGVEQSLLDALWTLTYGERDPGPPAAVDQPSAVP